MRRARSATACVRQLVDEGIEAVAVELDATATDDDPAGVRAMADLAADIMVDLGSSDYDARAAQRESTTWFTAASLAAADASGAEHVVFVSSAMVYGAFANNPVPLTEEAVLRPDVEFVFARQLASAEELVEEWRRADPADRSPCCGPSSPMAEDGRSRLALRSPPASVSGFGEDDPPSQFLHLDDLAGGRRARGRASGSTACSTSPPTAGSRVSGSARCPANVPGSRCPSGPPRWSAACAGGSSAARSRPGLRSYTREPWVVANGRLRRRGWAPTVTNEQAYVEGTEAKWWTMVTPKRRQELALGAGCASPPWSAIVVAVSVRRRRSVTAGRRSA